jgi:YVTN family beta-propeller protein
MQRIFLCILTVAGMLGLAGATAAQGEPATVRVAGLIARWVRGDKEANFRRLEPMIREAAAKGAKIVVTTECFLDGYAIADRSIPLADYRALGEAIPEGAYFKKVAALAAELKVYLIAGMTEADGDQRYNTVVVIGPDGRLIGKYRKQNLGHELGRNTPGTLSSVFPTAYGKIGVMICADRTDPEIVKRFCDNGADFLICPSGGMFGPKTNDPIVQARSKENKVFIVFVHPVEFLVTGPDGSIRERTLLGDNLLVTKAERDGAQDARRICYFELPRLSRAASSASGRPKLYVANSGGDSIHVIDLKALKVIGEIKTAKHPHGAAVSGDGRRLFSSIESDHTLLVIDTAADKVLQTIKLTKKPNQCAVTPDGKLVGVPIRDGDSVDIVDIAQGKVVKTLPVKVPHNCYNAGRNDRMFVTSMGDHKVNLIDLKSLSYAAEIPVGGIPRPLAVTRDEKTLYCALSDLHGFVIADVASRRVTHTIELPKLPADAKFPVPNTPTHGLELSPDEKELWVTSCATDTIYVFDVGSKQIVGKVGVGKGPNWVTFSPDGAYCCVSNVLSDDVSILDVAKRQEVARLKVGPQPKRLVVASPFRSDPPQADVTPEQGRKALRRER